MTAETPESPSFETKISYILDGFLQYESPSLIEPMMVSLSGDDRYYATLVNLASACEPEFGEFLLSYAKETSESLNSDCTIVFFPTVVDQEEKGKKQLRIVNDIDFSQKEHKVPYLIGLMDDGDELKVLVYSVAGIPGTCLMTAYVDNLGAKPEFFNTLLDLWGIDEELRIACDVQYEPNLIPKGCIGNVNVDIKS